MDTLAPEVNRQPTKPERPSSDELRTTLFIKTEGLKQAQKMQTAIDLVANQERTSQPIPPDQQEAYKDEIDAIHKRRTRASHPESWEHIRLTSRVNTLGSEIGVVSAEIALDNTTIAYLREKGVAISDEALQAAITHPDGNITPQVATYLDRLQAKGIDPQEVFRVPRMLRAARDLQRIQNENIKQPALHDNHYDILNLVKREGLSLEAAIQQLQDKQEEINVVDGERKLYVVKAKEVALKMKRKDELAEQLRLTTSEIETDTKKQINEKKEALFIEAMKPGARVAYLIQKAMENFGSNSPLQVADLLINAQHLNDLTPHQARSILEAEKRFNAKANYMTIAAPIHMYRKLNQARARLEELAKNKAA